MQKINSEIRFSDRDEYSRKSVAEKLSALLSSNEISISPVMIDGGWGTGKTEFCYKLINLLKEDHPDFNAIYIDAFSEDHVNAPTMILLAAIFKILPEQEQSKLIKKAIPVLRFGLKTALKAGANFVLRQNGENIADEFQHAIKETSEAAINESVEKILKEHIDSEKNIRLLKKALEKTSHEKPIII
ncbi:P-loop NTPase fold protein, partial [Pectobacterium versatile]